MTSPELENLVTVGVLKRAPMDEDEFAGLIHSGEVRLTDAMNDTLSLESRFDLAYNAAHALSLCALRRRGYRSENRYVVFQALPHSLGIRTATWRLLGKCHGLRNRAEYEGVLDLDAGLIADLIAAAIEVRDALRKGRTSSR